MSFLKFLPFRTYFGLFFYSFLAFGYIWGQIPIDCHMCIYKLCKHAKNALINGISMGIFNFYHFFNYLNHFLPFLAHFWPLIIFGVKFL